MLIGLPAHSRIGYKHCNKSGEKFSGPAATANQPTASANKHI